MSEETRKASPLRAVAIAAAVLLALAAALAGMLVVLFPPARLRAIVSEQLHHALTRDVRFADASLGFWPPVRIAVERPELAEPGGFARGTAFSADAIELDLDLFALLSRRLSVRRLTLERPVLHLLLRADGSSNLDSLAAPAKPGGAQAPAMDLDVRAFAVREGRVLVDDVRAGRRTAFALRTTLSLSAEQGGQRIATAGATDITDLATGPLSAARLSDLNQGLARLVWHVEHRGKYDGASRRLALERLALAVGRSQLVLSGLVDDVGTHARFDLAARGDGFEFGDLLTWVAVADAAAVKGLSGSGRMAFDLRLRGAAAAPGAAPTAPVVTGWLTVKGASFRYAGAPADVRDLALRAEFAPDTLRVPAASATVAGQPVRARLLARRFADPLVDFAVQGRIDLAAVAPMLAQPGTKLSGRADVDVRGAGRAKDPGSLALDGTARLQDVRVESKDLPRPIEAVNGTVLLSADRAQVKQLTARAGKSSWALDATVTRPLALLAKPDSVPPAQVAFDFRSPHLDLAELLPTTPGAPFLPNARGGGTVAIDRLMQGKLDVAAVRAQVALSPAALESPAFSMKGYGGTVRGSAKFDLRDTRAPGYAVKATIDSVQADDLLSAWTPARGLLRGALNTSLDFSGRGQTPQDLAHTLTLLGLAALSHGTLGPGPTLDAIAQFVKVPRLKQVGFRELKIPMRIEQGRLITDGVTMDGPAGNWKMTGAVGFDGALDYAVSVTLPPDVAAALDARSALAAGALADDKGQMLLDLHVTGSAKSPRVAWDTRAMRDRLAGRASQALVEQRTKIEADAKEAAQRALAQRLGLAADSTRRTSAAEQLQAVRDSLRRAAGGALKNFFSPPVKKPLPLQLPPDTSAH
jgi:hypothetical protein